MHRRKGVLINRSPPPPSAGTPQPPPPRSAHGAQAAPSFSLASTSLTGNIRPVSTAQRERTVAKADQIWARLAALENDPDEPKLVRKPPKSSTTTQPPRRPRDDGTDLFTVVPPRITSSAAPPFSTPGTVPKQPAKSRFKTVLPVPSAVPLSIAERTEQRPRGDVVAPTHNEPRRKVIGDGNEHMIILKPKPRIPPPQSAGDSVLVDRKKSRQIQEVYPSLERAPPVSAPKKQRNPQEAKVTVKETAPYGGQQMPILIDSSPSPPRSPKKNVFVVSDSESQSGSRTGSYSESGSGSFEGDGSGSDSEYGSDSHSRSRSGSYSESGSGSYTGSQSDGDADDDHSDVSHRSARTGRRATQDVLVNDEDMPLSYLLPVARFQMSSAPDLQVHMGKDGISMEDWNATETNIQKFMQRMKAQAATNLNAAQNMNLRLHQNINASFFARPEVNAMLYHHDMGSGKTRNALVSASTKCGPILVITKIKMRGHFVEELHALNNLRLAAGQPLLISNHQIVITSYEQLGKLLRAQSTDEGEQHRLRAARKQLLDMVSKLTVIVDEAHLLKNYYSSKKGAHTRSCYELVRNAKNVLLLSGTPWPNSRADVGALINMLHPGEEEIYDMKKEYIHKKLNSNKTLPEIISHLHCRISYFFPTTDRDPRTPQVKYHDVDVEMTPAQDDLFVQQRTHQEDFKKQKDSLNILASVLERGGSIYTALGKAKDAFYTTLRTATNRFEELKLKALLHMLAKHSNERHAVFSAFKTDGIDMIAAAIQADKRLQHMNIFTISGDTKESDVVAILHQYNVTQNRQPAIMLFTPAASMGVDFKNTPWVHLYEEQFTPSMKSQAGMRAVRYNAFTEDNATVHICTYKLRRNPDKAVPNELAYETGDTILEHICKAKEIDLMKFTRGTTIHCAIEANPDQCNVGKLTSVKMCAAVEEWPVSLVNDLLRLEISLPLVQQLLDPDPPGEAHNHTQETHTRAKSEEEAASADDEEPVNEDGVDDAMLVVRDKSPVPDSYDVNMADEGDSETDEEYPEYKEAVVSGDEPVSGEELDADEYDLGDEMLDDADAHNPLSQYPIGTFQAALAKNSEKPPELLHSDDIDEFVQGNSEKTTYVEHLNRLRDWSSAAQQTLPEHERTSYELLDTMPPDEFKLLQYDQRQQQLRQYDEEKRLWSEYRDYLVARYKPLSKHLPKTPKEMTDEKREQAKAWRAQQHKEMEATRETVRIRKRLNAMGPADPAPPRPPPGPGAARPINILEARRKPR